MWNVSYILSSSIWLLILVITVLCDVAVALSRDERESLREEARDMFYHAYRAYMENAFPADELMPLSCKGRWRGSEPSRGDIDDALGNFSLTLVDSLDTLVILGDLDEFESAVKLVIQHVQFNTDIVVSVFETNIRVLGGLLSAHILTEYLHSKSGIMSWYRGELLHMAKDIGYRLLPSFNTTTGIPHPRINLMYGLKSPILSNSRETCTACAGTMLLEFAALSRLTGESIFEEKAHRAMDSLWQMRHRSSDLMGTVLNVYSGDWVRRDSGVGAGIDSYYEYLLKGYILLGEDRYLDRFNKHYTAVMKYISQGPLLLDVHMHRPNTNCRNFMDALLAFWPGLQVLKGDVKPAIETHEVLYQIHQRHNFLPEAFTADFQVHWGQHPLRPEFLESTYLLYRATGDDYYLDVGKQVLQSLQKHARVPCGYAAVKDVRTGGHEDRMDSFVLAETFKYLYLLFSESSDVILNMDDFIFTTEAHLLPLSLARLNNLTTVPLPPGHPLEDGLYEEEDIEFAQSCPNTNYLFPNQQPHTIRKPLKDLVEASCPTRTNQDRKITAAQFQASNSEHLRLVLDMGISIVVLPDNRVQLLHTFAKAKSASDAEEGLLFMQEMIELSKNQTPDNPPRVVYYHNNQQKRVVIDAGPAQFGKELTQEQKLSGKIVLGNPIRMCSAPLEPLTLQGKIVLMERGDCMFVDKARRIESCGAIGGLVMDNTKDTTSTTSSMFAMSGDGTDDVSIPMLFLFSKDAQQLLYDIQLNPQLVVTLAESVDGTTAGGNKIRNQEEDSFFSPLNEEDSVVSKMKGHVTEFIKAQGDKMLGEAKPTDSLVIRVLEIASKVDFRHNVLQQLATINVDDEEDNEMLLALNDMLAKEMSEQSLSFVRVLVLSIVKTLLEKVPESNDNSVSVTTQLPNSISNLMLKYLKLDSAALQQSVAKVIEELMEIFNSINDQQMNVNTAIQKVVVTATDLNPTLVSRLKDHLLQKVKDEL